MIRSNTDRINQPDPNRSYPIWQRRIRIRLQTVLWWKIIVHSVTGIFDSKIYMTNTPSRASSSFEEEVCANVNSMHMSNCPVPKNNTNWFNIWACKSLNYKKRWLVSKGVWSHERKRWFWSGCIVRRAHSPRLHLRIGFARLRWIRPIWRRCLRAIWRTECCIA